jgi:hypothetical protein
MKNFSFLIQLFIYDAMSEQGWVISDKMEEKSSVVPQIMAAIGGKNVSIFVIFIRCLSLQKQDMIDL